ncbi:hypothetical protein NBRC116583_25830 [Arenicella sp. 4NH20-0111]|uniref:hypothetical protein n=1 Tax=Arenicella sp. 4NH20-0111 TaxID=3127648 RepID=UPI00310850C7
MKKLTSSLFALTFLFAAAAQAGEPAKSSGHAVTLCKSQAGLAHEGYKRARASKIKLTRGVYKIKLKVVTEEGSVKTVCEIAKDGSISYTKA